MITAIVESKKITKMSQEIHAANAAKGFWKDGKNRNVGELLMLVTTELAEALEAHRAGRFANRAEFDSMFERVSHETDDPNGNASHTVAFNAHIKDTFEDELADAIIRILDMCGGLDIEIGWHIWNKLSYNANRPHLHGKSY